MTEPGKTESGNNAGLAVFLQSLLFAVRCFDDFSSPSYRRFFKSGPRAQFLQYAGLFKFLFKALQRLINGFVLFYVDNDHMLKFLIRAANIR